MAELVPHGDDAGRTERIVSTADLPAIGQWYWVNSNGNTWLGCVVLCGSNFVELNGPGESRNWSHSIRVHIDNVDQKLTRVHNYKAVLAQKVDAAQAEVSRLLGEVQAITSSLGVAPTLSIQSEASGTGTGLATLSAQTDIGQYKRALIAAKSEQIPALKDQLRTATEVLTNWMSAETIGLKALVGQQTDVIAGINDRIFNIELYAGLVEYLVQFADGQPAASDEKLRVFQRMLYCDEEALLGYDTGGMEISDLDSFQEWMSIPENRDRILPYPRCLVAMRVRRHTKEREWDGTLSSLFTNMRLERSDKKTFLFIRNGEKLYCISTGIEFDELIFPELSSFEPGEPIMFRLFAGKVDKFMMRREFDFLSELYADFEGWAKANQDDAWHRFNYPRYSELGSFSPREWEPFDYSSVYYDEMAAKLSNEVKKYNRVAVIIQGLFDRSDCLSPHPPVKSWTPEGFRSAIELIYDGMGLTYGEPPCFESYRAHCNALIDENSVLVGQEEAWMIREAENENRRMANNWRVPSNFHRVKRYQPHGDPGPGFLARPRKVMKRSQKVEFAWLRNRRTQSAFNEGTVTATITVPFAELFNVSAYKKGDFKMFFADPRTREQYLKWAPMLIAAEDYYAKRRFVSGEE